MKARLKAPKFELILADFLDLPLKDLLKKWLKPSEKAKVISNIPYSLTSPILQILLPLESHISSLTLTIQSEVATRCVAKASQKDYSALSLFVQVYSNPKILFHIKPTAFYPVPSITSNIIRFDLKPFPSSLAPSLFFQLVKCAFGQRRKMLRRSLRSLFSKERIENALQTLKLASSTRPQELSTQTFLSLALHFENHIERSPDCQGKNDNE